MSEKLTAGLVAAGVISPLCAVCILGPAAVGALFAGVFGWLSGSGFIVAIAVMAAGVLLRRHFLRPRRSHLPAREAPFEAMAGTAKDHLHAAAGDRDRKQLREIDRP